MLAPQDKLPTAIYVAHVEGGLSYTERRVCRALHLSRSSVRYAAQPRADEAPLTGAIIELASQYTS